MATALINTDNIVAWQQTHYHSNDGQWTHQATIHTRAHRHKGKDTPLQIQTSRHISTMATRFITYTLLLNEKQNNPHKLRPSRQLFDS